MTSRTTSVADLAAMTELTRAPKSGAVGFVVEGSANAADCFSRATQRGIGLSRFLGGEVRAEVAIAELAADADTRVIAVVVDDVRPQQLAAAIDDAVSRDKAVIVLPVGPLPRAATAAGAVPDTTVLRGFLARHRAHLVESYGDLLNTAYLFGLLTTFPASERICLLTGSGGAGIIMADQAETVGLDVAPISTEGQARMREIWPLAGVTNPVDTTAQVLNDPAMLAEFTRVVLEEQQFSATVTFMAGIGLNPEAAARRRKPLLPVLAEHPEVVNVVTMLSVPQAQDEFEADGMPVFEDPADAVGALRRAVQEHAFRSESMPHKGPEAPSLDDLPGQLGRPVDALPDGPTISLTLTNDPEFGVIAAVRLRLTDDSALDDVALGFALSTPDQAAAVLRDLRGFPALTGARGRPVLDVGSLSRLVATASLAATALAPGERLTIGELAPAPVADGGGIQFVPTSLARGAAGVDHLSNSQENL